MRKILFLFQVLFLCLLFTSNSYASVFHAKVSGFWHHPDTWLEGAVPSVGDDVVIDGFTVTVNNMSGNIDINRLDLRNINQASTVLLVSGENTFTVQTSVMVKSTYNYDVVLKIIGQAVFKVMDKVIFERTAGSSYSEGVFLHLKDDAELIVKSDFIYNYDDADVFELVYEVLLENNAKFFVDGNTYLVSRGGVAFNMEMRDSTEMIVKGDFIAEMTGGINMFVAATGGHTTMQIEGDLNVTNAGGSGAIVVGEGLHTGSFTVHGNANLESQVEGHKVNLKSAGLGSVLEVKKNISLKAVDNANTIMKVVNDARLKLGGTFFREADGYGLLQMDETSVLELNGTGPQDIPATKMLSNAVDSLFISNLEFNNTSGAPITLVGQMYVNDYLDLTGGILKTTSTNILVLGKDATIDPGSETSYVDGPIRKIGGTNGAPFIFPTGHDAVYAPIEISPITGSSSVYTAEYRKGDPPPFGELAAGINSITENQYWTLDNDGGTEQVNVTLHWSDPVALGIENMAALLVTSYNTTTETWTNHGNIGTTGSTSANTPGSVMSVKGDPPPFGENMAFTVGSEEVGTLPVELMRFEAIQEDDMVYLQWETASEDNASHFIVEHSFDGLAFKPLTTVSCRGGEAGASLYDAQDAKPYYGSNFYRLKVVDKDNSFEYSSIEVVTFEVIPVVSIYPNPVHEFLNLEIGGESDGEGIMEVIDRSGSRIYQGEISFENGTFQVSTASLNIFTPGTYVIRIVVDGQEQVLKFIKLK